MIKEPFSLDEWKKDQSRKVVTDFGEPVKIVFTEGMGNYPVLAVIYDGNTTDSEWFTANGFGYDEHSRLYFGGMVCTPFQERLVKFYNDRTTLPHDTDGVCSQHDLDELLENASAELLAIAYEQFKKDLPMWRKIRRGDRFPCDAFLCIDDDYFSYMPNAKGVCVGDDGYYLPKKDLEKIPKEGDGK